MKKCRTGILLLAAVILLLGCTACFRRNKDKDKDKENGTSATQDGTSLLPVPDGTLPGEDGETTPQMTTTQTTAPTQESTTTKKTETTTVTDTTTKKPETTTKVTETTTKKPETTTKVTETTTKKPETTTKTPETTTTKPETTTKAPETTTTKPETTTKTPETTTAKPETTTKTPETTTTQPETTTKVPETTVTPPTPDTGNNGQTTSPEIGAGEWLHFEEFRDHHAGAAAYLGQSAAQMPIGDLIEYFGLPLTEQDITVIDHGEGRGDTWYLILPRYRDTMVRIREAEQTSKRRTRAGELLAEGMHPMLIRCEGDEALADIYVELIHGDETVSFPLKTGGDFHERVLDITPKQMTRS